MVLPSAPGMDAAATAEVVDDVSHAGPRALLREEGVPNVNHQNQVTAANHDDR
jgi:hypothetical protein